MATIKLGNKTFGRNMSSTFAEWDAWVDANDDFQTALSRN